MKYCALTATLVSCLILCTPVLAEEPETLQVMLQGASSARLSNLVENAGGTVTHDLHVIDAVGARLSREQLDAVLQSPLITRHIDDLADTERPDEDDEEEEDCKVRGHIELDLTPDGIQWPLYNKRETPARMESLQLSWPTSLGGVKAISVGDTAVAAALYNDASNGTLAIDFHPSTAPIVNDRATVDITFQPSTPLQPGPPLSQSDFSISVSFAGGCSDDLVPGYDNNHGDFYYNSAAGIDAFHLQGITGKGVTVAVIDSGLWEHDALKNDTRGENRLLARYNARTDISGSEAIDDSGHGTHMTSIIANSDRTIQNGRPTGTYKGVAPDANLVAVKVLDRGGFAHVLDIVRAIQWVVDNREKYNIRILNLSIAQTPRWPYWEEPVNQAVMKAWTDGIAVVAAAGNEGPEHMTIGSPGNQPQIITVGAVTDSWTTDTRDDDYIPDFSSRGPTHTGHVKPDVVALGGHMTGLIHPDSDLAVEQPEDILRTGEFVSTGSSQATALASGVLALLLQLEPDLSPDDLKCKLITSAEPAINRDGKLAYSPFVQGYGYLSARRAVTLGETSCGNAEIVPPADTEDKELLLGPTLAADDGSPALPGLEGMVSDESSEKGLSKNRKWGVKDHIERVDSGLADTISPEQSPFNWQELYLQEKATIERLSRQAQNEAPKKQ